jgi:quinol monooxygenase YgiN
MLTAMELAIIARFHARPGCEDAVAFALCQQVPETRSEPGCLAIAAFRSTREPGLFWIHSRWRDDAAFDVHAGLPRTRRFVADMELLIDHPFDAARARAIA